MQAGPGAHWIGAVISADGCHQFQGGMGKRIDVHQTPGLSGQDLLSLAIADALNIRKVAPIFEGL